MVENPIKYFEANDFILCTKCNNLLMIPGDARRITCSTCETTMDFTDISEAHKTLSYKKTCQILSNKIYKERSENGHIYTEQEVVTQRAQEAYMQQAAAAHQQFAAQQQAAAQQQFAAQQQAAVAAQQAQQVAQQQAAAAQQQAAAAQQQAAAQTEAVITLQEIQKGQDPLQEIHKGQDPTPPVNLPPIKSIKKDSTTNLKSDKNLKKEMSKMKNYITEIDNKNFELKEELDFFKSLFKTHRNSVVFNLKIKKKQKKCVWVDNINDDLKYIESLDRDDEVIEWLKPVKCNR